jgi:uncharacterized membrane protein
MSTATQYPTSGGGLRSIPAELYSFFLMTTTKENTYRNFNFEEARGDYLKGLTNDLLKRRVTVAKRAGLGDLMEHSFTLLALLALTLQALEDNFTLAVIVFIIGFIATLITLIFIVSMHRYWERRSDSNAGED